MFHNDKRVLALHYLEQGVANAEIARQLKIGRRTMHNWIAEEQLEAESCEDRYGPRAAATVEARRLQADHRSPPGGLSATEGDTAV